MAITQTTLLLIVRRDQADQVLTDKFDRLERVAMVIDRRHGERRTQQKPRIAIQRRRADRRTRTWVDAALTTEGVALVRM
jgi:hypothetical protein